MNTRETFLECVTNYLETPTSGALMISGAWGSGKTYYIDHTLIDKLKASYFPVKISLFGVEKIDNLEKQITESFLFEYSEGNLSESISTEKESVKKLGKLFGKMRVHKVGKVADSITDFIPYFKQYVDTGRLLDAYYTLSASCLPKEKLVIILDDLERAVESIEPHLLLGAINNLVETKQYKVIVIANDSYFNKSAKNYLDFKEKIIERTLLFPSNIIEVYKELVHECSMDYGSDFETFMTNPKVIDVINPLDETNNDNAEHRENLQNIRIIKFAVVNFAKIYQALSETMKSLSDDKDLQDFLLSLWALIVGLSIEYKRNRLTYQERNAYIKASAVDSFVIDLGEADPNPFDDQGQENEEEQKLFEISVEKIRRIFKFYIERRSLPLISTIHVFDVITAGLSVDKELLIERWHEYKLSIERQKDNPALLLLNRFMYSIGSFSNEEFPERLKELAKYIKQADFPDGVSYINAATYVQHYGSLIGYDEKKTHDIIIKGIDTHFENTIQLSLIAKSNLEVIASEVPSESKWVLDYTLKKTEEFTEQKRKDSIEEAIQQFKEDMKTLAIRLAPDPSTLSTPDFFDYPILAKIPEEVIFDKIKNITPVEVEALSSIIRSRFVEHHSMVGFKDEKVFLDNVMKGIEAREGGMNNLSDYLLKDHLVDPLLSKLG